MFGTMGQARARVGVPGPAAHLEAYFHVKGGPMNLLDLTKATLVCGSLAVLAYSFPVIGQAVMIGVLCLVWLSYVHRTIK
jgi:hypothetical protein